MLLLVTMECVAMRVQLIQFREVLFTHCRSIFGPNSPLQHKLQSAWNDHWLQRNMSAESVGTSVPAVFPIAVRRKSSTFLPNYRSSTKRDPKRYSEHVTRLQLVLATTSVLVPCGILLLLQQIQLQTLSQRMFALEERLLDLVGLFATKFGNVIWIKVGAPSGNAQFET